MSCTHPRFKGGVVGEGGGGGGGGRRRGKETDRVLKQWPNYALLADLKYKIYIKSVNKVRK
jgi:hypothetical protein